MIGGVSVFCARGKGDYGSEKSEHKKEKKRKRVSQLVARHNLDPIHSPIVRCLYFCPHLAPQHSAGMVWGGLLSAKPSRPLVTSISFLPSPCTVSRLTTCMQTTFCLQPSIVFWAATPSSTLIRHTNDQRLGERGSGNQTPIDSHSRRFVCSLVARSSQVVCKRSECISEAMVATEYTIPSFPRVRDRD